jgi:hypothetical protein
MDATQTIVDQCKKSTYKHTHKGRKSNELNSYQLNIQYSAFYE